MEESLDFTGGIQFEFKQTDPNNPSIIKVIGVGGGGGNAINHMYNQGHHDVTYVVSNTDKKALQDSPVPNKLQLGKDGLGAGNKPERARKAAIESIEEIKQMLNDGTRMVFITAGMGGGTGTGAAPIIAQCAKEAGILTVGIVTIPFLFEGNPKINQALDGVEEISKYVDALLVINNERLREIYPELSVLNAFAKADDTLSVAACSIAEIITMRGVINLDFQDVCTVLKDGGVAIMSTGYGEGENRVTRALEQALHSPLLNNNDIFNSQRVLLNINFCGSTETGDLRMEEMNEIHDFMSKFKDEVEVKWGLAQNPDLGDKVKITLLATGFGLHNVPGLAEAKKAKTRDEEMRDEEIRDELAQRKEDYYHNTNQTPRRRYHNIYIYTEQDMDNDNVISMVDKTPTYKRSKQELEHIKAGKQNKMETPEAEAPADNVIIFEP